MSNEPAIIGFRQDRAGARIVGILNVMRLSRLFGVEARFQWLSQPDGPYPELSDPAAFFKPNFIARHIDVVTEAPDLGGRRSVTAASAQLNLANFGRALEGGALFHSESAFAVDRFQGEDAAQVAMRVRDIAAELKLAAPLAKALRKMQRQIEKMGGGPPAAIHVRRGDILDGDPWSYSAWPSKYVPDEFLQAYADRQPGPVVAFSDTPDAVLHLAKGRERIIPVDRLLAEHAGDVPPGAARDVLELLLMARCRSVGAPSQSAFSRAAQVVGGGEVVALPYDLPVQVNRQAYDALLDRVIAAPDSFYAPGDLAQSAAYAIRHVVSTNRVPDLLAAFEGRADFTRRFPFVLVALAEAAEQTGHAAVAQDLAERALAEKMLRPRDRNRARNLIMLGQSRAKLSRTEPAQDEEAGDLDAAFVERALKAQGADSRSLAASAWLILSRPGAAGTQLLFPPLLGQMIQSAAEPDPQAEKLLPLWAFLCDWDDLVRSESLRAGMRHRPAINVKLAAAERPLHLFEAAAGAGIDPPEPDDDVALLLGHAASVMVLHGRLRRAYPLLNWLEKVRPADAITARRLSNAFFQAGNRKAGWMWLDNAISRAPGNALLHLSAGLRAHEHGFPNRRRDHLAAAVRLWPEFGMAERVQRRLKKQAARAADPASAARASPAGG